MLISPPPDDHEDEATLREARALAASRSTWISVAVNLALTVLQLVVGVQAKSQALVADAIHSLSDLLSDFIVLLAGRQSRKAADADHPYGHQRFETAASLALGLLLLGVGLGMVGSAAARLQQPAAIEPVAPLALWIAVATLVAKEALFRYLMAVARRVRSSMLAANAWHSRSDAASSLVVGLGIAGNLAGYPLLDPIAALIVGFLVARMGWTFGWNAINDLMDRAVDADQIEAIHATLAATPGVIGVHELRTRRMGDLIAADVHLEVEATLSVEAGHDIAVEARRRVMQAHPVLSLMIHVDPWRRPDRDHDTGPLSGR